MDKNGCAKGCVNGVLFVPNGPDDYDKEPCDCMYATRAEQASKMSFAERKRTICPVVNCSDSKCDFMHD